MSPRAPPVRAFRRPGVALLQSRLNPEQLPHIAFGKGASKTFRYFPNKLPIGVQKDGGCVFAYFVNRPALVDFGRCCIDAVLHLQRSNAG